VRNSSPPNQQKKILDNATGGQRRAALEMGIGLNNQNWQQLLLQQKRDAYHDLDLLNFTVEKENEAHDFFGKGLAGWQKNVMANSHPRMPSTSRSSLMIMSIPCSPPFLRAAYGIRRWRTPCPRSRMAF